MSGPPLNALLNDEELQKKGFQVLKAISNALNHDWKSPTIREKLGDTMKVPALFLFVMMYPDANFQHDPSNVDATIEHELFWMLKPGTQELDVRFHDTSSHSGAGSSSTKEVVVYLQEYSLLVQIYMTALLVVIDEYVYYSTLQSESSSIESYIQTNSLKITKDLFVYSNTEWIANVNKYINIMDTCRDIQNEFINKFGVSNQNLIMERLHDKFKPLIDLSITNLFEDMEQNLAFTSSHHYVFLEEYTRMSESSEHIMQAFTKYLLTSSINNEWYPFQHHDAKEFEYLKLLGAFQSVSPFLIKDYRFHGKPEEKYYSIDYSHKEVNKDFEVSLGKIGKYADVKVSSKLNDNRSGSNAMVAFFKVKFDDHVSSDVALKLVFHSTWIDDMIRNDSETYVPEGEVEQLLASRLFYMHPTFVIPYFQQCLVPKSLFSTIFYRDIYHPYLIQTFQSIQFIDLPITSSLKVIVTHAGNPVEIMKHFLKQFASYHFEYYKNVLKDTNNIGKSIDSQYGLKQELISLDKATLLMLDKANYEHTTLADLRLFILDVKACPDESDFAKMSSWFLKFVLTLHGVLSDIQLDMPFFRHNDFHGNNILLSKNPFGEDVVFRLNNEKVKVTYLKDEIVPKMHDFLLATGFLYTNSENKDLFIDHSEFNQRFRNNWDNHYATVSVNTTNPDFIELTLFDSQKFSSYLLTFKKEECDLIAGTYFVGLNSFYAFPYTLNLFDSSYDSELKDLSKRFSTLGILSVLSLFMDRSAADAFSTYEQQMNFRKVMKDEIGLNIRGMYSQQKRIGAMLNHFSPQFHDIRQLMLLDYVNLYEIFISHINVAGNMYAYNKHDEVKAMLPKIRRNYVMVLANLYNIIFLFGRGMLNLIGLLSETKDESYNAIAIYHSWTMNLVNSNDINDKIFELFVLNDKSSENADETNFVEHMNELIITGITKSSRALRKFILFQILRFVPVLNIEKYWLHYDHLYQTNDIGSLLQLLHDYHSKDAYFNEKIDLNIITNMYDIALTTI